jgi:hypothetical protein
LDGQFNKKTDIWALGCVFCEVAIGEKVFTSDWAVITYAQNPQSRSLEPFTPDAHPKAAKLNELIALMLALTTDQRCNIASACNQILWMISPISRTSTGPYYLSEDPKYFWSSETLVGTESPIWTSISPRIDQIIPPSVLYDDLEALIARRKQLISSRAIYFLKSDHPVRIWTQLYLGYTFFHHPSPAMSAQALPYLGTPLFSVSTLLDRQLHDQMYASLMSAFGWFTQVLNPLESRTLLLQLIAQSRIKLSNGEANDLKAVAETKDLIAGAEASRFMDPNPTWVVEVDYIQLRAYREFVDNFSPDVPLPAGSLVKAVMKSYFETPFHRSAFDGERSSFQTSVKIHISDALTKSRALFGPAFESRLTMQLEIHQKLLELLGPVGPESFVMPGDHLPRLLDLFGRENQDVKSVVEQLKMRVEEMMNRRWHDGDPTLLKAEWTRKMLSALKL